MSGDFHFEVLELEKEPDPQSESYHQDNSARIKI